MSEEKILREKLELLKKCVYEELNQIKSSVSSDEVCLEKIDKTKDLPGANNDGNTLQKRFKALKHKKALKRSSRRHKNKNYLKR